jgi:hypothetical protein
LGPGNRNKDKPLKAFFGLLVGDEEKEQFEKIDTRT